MGQKQVYKRNLKPRQLDFIQYYTDPKSDTYSNATRSAVKAGYTYNYAKSNASKMLVPLVSDKIQQKENRLIEKATRRERMLDKAEQGLESDLAIDDSASPALRALRNKTGTFIAETVGKAVYSKASVLDKAVIAVITPNTNETIQATMQHLLGSTDTNDAPTYTIEGDDEDE